MSEAVAALPQRKMSRYRTQRNNAPPLPSVPISPKQSDEETAIARSKSRYRNQHRSNTQNSQDSYGLPRSPPSQTSLVKDLPVRPTPAYANNHHVERQQPFIPESLSDQPVEYLNRRVDSGTTVHSSTSSQDLRKSRERRRPSPKHDSQPQGQLFPPHQPTTNQQPLIPDGPPSSDRIRATKSTTQLPKLESERSGPFAFFKRKRHTPMTSSQDPSPLSSPSEKDVKVGSAGIAPGMDAPVSAVNAGDRKVLVECGNFKMNFPVTPTTTSADLIKSAATTMSNPVNIKSAILLEHFVTVGVHRPLRRYEHIRDIMNSWDHDTQNSLLLIDPGTGESELELSITGVSKTRPPESSWLLYYSQTPGKWDKRMIHLKKDGQVTYQKDPKKPNEQTAICHLSDFDIYTPTQDKLKKKVKPPKKHCFAIKSQQKSIMFENTTNFVHFFCIDDQAVGENFNAAIQSWRSWYLVNVMGEGKKVDLSTDEEKRSKAALCQKSSAPAGQNHKRLSSLESHYQLGTFSPLVDMNQFSQDSAAVSGATRFEETDMQLTDVEPLANLTRKMSIRSAKLSSSMKQNHDSNVIGRRTSQRQHPTTQDPQDSQRIRYSHDAHRNPLVNLTRSNTPPQPVYDLNQASAKNGGLIETAGNRDPSGLSRRSNTVRDRQNLSSESNAFTGEGLLASTQAGWGGASRGRGVLDGSRAKGPLVDLSTTSQFEQGSLLRKVERIQGPSRPNIDRQKYRERVEKTGEGF